uniref:Acyl-CoA dehydrogenase/oxidase N-terminal domain-containing protein n=1 Tax=Denticeps clupeoides TaxID=299321 RepID=A0AAY4E2S6_9TELE
LFCLFSIFSFSLSFRHNQLAKTPHRNNSSNILGSIFTSTTFLAPKNICAAGFCPKSSWSRNLMAFGERDIFNENHNIFRFKARGFFDRDVAPHQFEIENGSRKVWEKAGSMDLLGVATPKKYGGHGKDFLSSAIMWEEQMYLNGVAPPFAHHSDFVMPYILKYGSEDQINRFIPEMLKGKCIGAIAKSESIYGGPDFRVLAKRNGSDWLLTGKANNVVNGGISDLVIVPAITKLEGQSYKDMLSLFLVRDGTKGFHKGLTMQAPRLRSQQISDQMVFDNLRLSEKDLLGEVNKGYNYIMMESPREQLANAVMSLSRAEYLFTSTVSIVNGKMPKPNPRMQAQLQEVYDLLKGARKLIDSHLKKNIPPAHPDIDYTVLQSMQCAAMTGAWGAVCGDGALLSGTSVVPWQIGIRTSNLLITWPLP